MSCHVCYSKCGLGYPESFGKALPHRSVCVRPYWKVGPMETRLEFSIRNTENPNGHMHHSYPQLSMQQDLSAQESYNSTNVPALEPSPLNGAWLNNECILLSQTAKSDTMKIVWHVSFSVQTPRKMRLSHWAATPPALNGSHSERDRIEAQVQFEDKNALRGHGVDTDSYPIRRLVLYSVRVLNGVFGFILHIVYYWRLRSTVGISIRGQWIQSARLLALAGKLILHSPHTAQTITPACAYIFLSAIQLSATMTGHSTHTERASSRIDAKSSWKFIGMSMLIFAMCNLVVNPFSYELIPSPLPPDPQVMSPSTAAKIFWASSNAAIYMSEALQLLMNHRAQTFAGMYKVSAWSMVAEQALKFVVYLPFIVGNIPNRDPLSWEWS
ncbi:hypothetical protein C8J57DRAFT_1543230 [Mycena rebaudengoi]|nr:hypothetical protein C8J57DRAFT_1543230 [Mycena rebaudengoi]